VRVLDTLDLGSVRAWAVAAAIALERRRHEIDALNVFPVADADTGTNLAVTMRAASDALARAVDDRSAVDAASSLRSLARGAALAARGNSGVILAEMLRGLADAAADAPDCDGRVLSDALGRAAISAYAAVGQPVEGTILSVARAVAGATSSLSAGATLPEVARCARDTALSALNRTPQQLAVLADAGVVDAGGQGLLVLLDALCGVVAGEPSILAAVLDQPASVHLHERERAVPGGTGPGFSYEVQYLLDAPVAALEQLRQTLLRLGDSLTTAQAAPGRWNVHVHVDDVGAAIEAGLSAGRPSDIRVTRFADQPVSRPSGRSERGRTSVVVALLATAALRALFEQDGVHVVVAAAEVANPAAVLAALALRSGSRCIVLPADEQLSAFAAEFAQLARQAGIDVAVVPCRSAMQALAAIAVHDGGRRSDDDIIAMAEASAATRSARIEVAQGPGLTTIGACRAGDVLGLIDGDVVEIGASAPAVLMEVLGRLLGIGGELLTAVVDAGSAGLLEGVIRDYVAKRAPFIELTIYSDEPLDCLALLGLE
jgi:uncharacterized protein